MTDRVAAQLYVFGGGAQNPDHRLEAVLVTLRKAGYEAAQGWLKSFDTDESASAWAELLRKHGVRMPAAYVGGPFHIQAEAEKTVDTIVDRAHRGHPYGLEIVVLNPDQLKREKTDEELEVQAKHLDLLGDRLASEGVKLGIHQHDPEMRSEAREWYHVLRNTDPAKVGFCLDLHWVLRGGMDPYQLLRDAGDRTVDLHLRNSKDGIWSEDFSEGDIDYAKVKEILDSIDYRGWYTVELAHEKETNITRSLGENLKRSREFVRQVLGA